MKNIKLILLLLLVFVAGNSCFKDKLGGEYYLTDEMKAKIPYKGYETIIFKTDSTDLIELTAGNRHDTIFKSYIDNYESDYVLSEYNYISFFNENYEMSLGMGGILDPPKGIAFDFVYLESNYFWRGGFGVFLPESPSTFLDSLLVNGSWIHEIYYDTLSYFYNQPYPHELQVIPVKSYYSTILGIVKVDFSDGSTWELKEIIW